MRSPPVDHEDVQLLPSQFLFGVCKHLQGQDDSGDCFHSIELLAAAERAAKPAPAGSGSGTVSETRDSKR